LPISIRLEHLIPGEIYERPYLAKLWSYRDWHAIGKGVITPANENKIILFITKEKQETLTQYRDYFDGNTLHAEGETDHSTDDRIINSESSNDEIYLFFREKHHTPFTYYGRVYLSDYEQNTDKPSHFTFKTSKSEVIAASSLSTEEVTHGVVADDFVPDSERKRKVRQHISYERSPKNRAKAIEIHGTVCNVCGFDFNRVYGSDLARDYIEVHHVKSLADIEGLVDPKTDLITLCSNCHSMTHRHRDRIIAIDELKKKLNT